MLNLLKHELVSRWRGILGWGIGLGLFGSMYIAIFPEFYALIGDLGDLSIYQAMNIDMATFAGFIASVTVQYVPIILGVYAILSSTGTLAGEEDQGTLELVVAMPLPRWQIVSMKALALIIATTFIVIIAGLIDVLTLTLISNTTEVDVTGGQLLVAVLNALPITWAFLMMGLFMAAFLPNRLIAGAVMAVIFIGSYFGTILVNLVESLNFIEPFLLFNYFDTSADVFREGVQVGDVIVLLGVAVVFFGLALLSFQRRNVTVGAWFWQRPRIPA